MLRHEGHAELFSVLPAGCLANFLFPKNYARDNSTLVCWLENLPCTGGVIDSSLVEPTHALDRGSYTRKHLSCRNGRSVNGFAAFLPWSSLLRTPCGTGGAALPLDGDLVDRWPRYRHNRLSVGRHRTRNFKNPRTAIQWASLAVLVAKILSHTGWDRCRLHAHKFFERTETTFSERSFRYFYAGFSAPRLPDNSRNESSSRCR